MIIKYCPQCNMKPYTTDMSATNCPFCNSSLMMEVVNSESDLNGRPVLNIEHQYESDYNTDPYVNNYGSENTIQQNVPANNIKENRNEITGRIYGYSNSSQEAGNYKRFVITKIIDALIYGQRTEDVLHRFYVRAENASYVNTDIPVVIHGTLSTGSGLIDNSLVKVKGKFHKGAFYARRIKVINNGYESLVRPQVSISKLFITILSFLLFFAGLGLYIFDKDGVDFGLVVVKNYLTIFAVVYLILFLISVIIIARSRFAATAIALSGKGMRGIGIINFIIAVILSFPIYKLMMSVGFSLSGAISAFAPVIILFVGIILLLSSIIRG